MFMASRLRLPALALIMLGVGCRPAVQERKYFAVSGVASAVDVESGLVSMNWQDHRSGIIEPIVGRVSQATEIFINGVSASLENVRPGDHGIVVVYKAVDPDEHWVVTSISVERDQSFMLSKPLPASPPAPDPASNPSE